MRGTTSPARACTLAKNAFDDAIAELDRVRELNRERTVAGEAALRLRFTPNGQFAFFTIDTFGLVWTPWRVSPSGIAEPLYGFAK